MIGIIDYGRGNLYSVSAALKRQGTCVVVSSEPGALDQADGLILPGVGAFSDAMGELRKKELDQYIKNYVRSRPLFGICLGMQLLFEASAEGGHTEGLGLLPGSVDYFGGRDPESGSRYKVPHMGWNELEFQRPDVPILKGVPEGHVYFVHSLLAHPAEPDHIYASADYYEDVPAIVGDGLITGAQFHPEKSGRTGLALLERFTELAEKGEAAL